MRRLLALLVLCSIAACGSDPVAPAPTCQDRTATNFGGPLPCTFPPECERNHTGTLVLINRGVTLTPRDAYVDGANVGTIPYGSQITLTVTAGIAHNVVFRSTIGGGVVSTAQPIVNQCSSFTLTNTF